MEEDFSLQDIPSHNPIQDSSFLDQSQDASFGNQAQLEPHVPPAEADTLPTTIQAESPISPASSRRRRSPLIKMLAIILLVLILLLAGGGSIYAMQQPQIPGASASIRITPNSQLLSKTYTTDVTIGSTDPTLNPFGARTVKITTPAKSLTVPATGTQQEPATYANGVVQLINGDAYHSIPVGDYSVWSNSRVAIEFYVSSLIPPGHNIPLIAARAMKPGPGGNIKTLDLNSWYNFPNAYIYVLNRQPFSGGRNAYNVTAVSQNDIDSATSQLTSQLQSELAADKAALNSKLAPSEQLLDPNGIHCQPLVKVDHSPGEQASEVTATGTMTCSAIVYTPAKAQAYGATLLEKDASAQWNGSYVLSGQIQTTLHKMFDLGKTITFTLDVQGLYIFQLNPDLAAHFASLVAGKTQASAQAVLLQQTGVSKISIQVSDGFGTALPASPQDIHISIL